MQSSMGILLHAGRELDVEIFDGEFAGDEAGKQCFASLRQLLVRISQQFRLLVEFRDNTIKLVLNLLAWHNDWNAVQMISIERWNASTGIEVLQSHILECVINKKG